MGLQKKIVAIAELLLAISAAAVEVDKEQLQTTRRLQSVSGTVFCGDGKAGNGICAESKLCCSIHGYCGSTNDYCGNRAPIPVPGNCGDGIVGNAICADTTLQCCSVYGWCGNTSDYCGNRATAKCDNVSNVMTVNFGYYASWASGRDPKCNLVAPQNIDVAGNHYTHLSYAFAGINATGQVAPLNDDYDGEVPLYIAFNALKTNHPKLKTLISVGGGDFNVTQFREIASTPENRARFASSVIAFLEKYGFDGVDVDWEFPVGATDFVNYPLLLKAIRDAAAGQTILITTAVSVIVETLDAGYNLSALADQLDFFNIMAYDINGPWNDPKLVGANTDLSYVKTAIQYMFQEGVPSSKMVLGLAAYGRTFYLSNPTNCKTPGCPFTAGGPGGCAGDVGDMPFFTVDEYIQSSNFDSFVYNPTTSSMELVTNGNVWISFDNLYTFNIKASYAAATCMRGVMWWSVDQLASPMVLSFAPATSPTPTPVPTLSPTALLPPTAAPRVVSIKVPRGFCFSGANTVEVLGKGTVLMKHLQLGDMVKDTGGNMVRVYSFGHMQPNSVVEYLQIHTKDASRPLEISKDHLVFADGIALPASSVSVGDMLTMEPTSKTRVTKIKMVTRTGTYAPFTVSGTIMVSGVAASIYVTHQQGSSVLILGNYKTSLSMHWLSHVFQSAHRLYCNWYTNHCSSETYTKDGISRWAEGPFRVSQWLLKQNGIVFAATFIPLFIVALFFYIVELCCSYSCRSTLAVAAIALVVTRIWWLAKKSTEGKVVYSN